MKMSEMKRIFPLEVGLVVVGFLLAQSAAAATVYNCSSKGTRCVAKVEVGSVGDQVKVLDEKAREVAKGRIIKRKGTFAIIGLTEPNKTIRRGYPIIVDIDSNSSSFEWAANFSNKD